MISEIINSYLAILLPVSISCLLLLLVGVYCIFKKNEPASKSTQALEDIFAIAGDDLITTQLDLARAFIESNNAQSAKEILKQIIKQGSPIQKQEAKQLLLLLNT